MRTYPKYKPTSINWIGDIPDSWSISKLKYVGQSLIGIIYSPDDLCEDEDEDGILVLRSSNVQEGILAFNDNVHVKKGKSIQEKHITRPGDILICARNGSAHLVGKCAYIDENHAGLTFGAFMSVFRSDYGRFMYYFFSSNIFKSQTGLFSTSTINQLTSETLNNLASAIPPLSEQQAIVTYLDQKTALIDELIAKKERKIELLKENRTALINHAVTKGLDPTVKYKDSGIEWIGEIPEHWNPIKIGYCSNLLTGNPWSSDEFDFDSGLKIVRGENVSEGFLRWGDRTRFWTQPVENNSKFFLEAEDIVVAMDGSKVGKNYVKILNSDLPLLLHQRMCRIRLKSNYSSSFLAYFISSEMFRYHIDISKTEPMIPHITQKNIFDFVFSIPRSLDEQHQIVEYLDNQTSLIDQNINLELQKIVKLKEYRQSLISNVVTGKICVLED